MSDARALASGKDHRQENFPVASVLLKPAARAPIMAFYRFARAADDVADSETATPAEKLRLLGEMRRGLVGAGEDATALALHGVMADRGLDPAHANDLLDAFVQDVSVARCADWNALIAYCRLSAMPVGRYVLDVHGESRATWPASDALCAALQIVNHLQDCAKDHRTLDRVYLPLDMLAEAGARVEDLAAPTATPELRHVIVACARRTQDLLRQSAGFASQIRDRRLAAEVAIIQRLAESLTRRLIARDPLSERVHHRPYEAAALAAGAVIRQSFRKRRA